MRIIAGKYRGRRLEEAKGESCRPTLDRVREAFFSSVSGRIEGAVFGDFFAGTGSVGLEALSRGAKKVVFAEAGAERRKMIEKNLVRILIPEDSGKWSLYADICMIADNPDWSKAFDVVYYDPPYAYLESVVEKEMAELFIEKARKCVKASGLFLLEAPQFFYYHLKDKGLVPEKIRSYGKIHLLYYPC